jgi:hypothetical protein
MVVFEGYGSTGPLGVDVFAPGAAGWSPIERLSGGGSYLLDNVAAAAADGTMGVVSNVRTGNNDNGHRVDRWDGSSWETVTSGLSGEEFSLAMTSAGDPVLAVQRWSTTYQISVTEWDGSGWVPFGSNGQISASGTGNYDPVLRLDAQDRPVVAWTSDGPAVLLARFDGSDWAGLGGSDGPSGLAAGSAGDLAVDAAGHPVVAVLHGNISVVRWDGSAWSTLGTTVNDAGTEVDSPGLALLPNGDPVVAYIDETAGPREVYVKRWDGNAWAEIDGSASDGGVSNSWGDDSRPHVAVVNDRVCVTWEHAGRIVLRCAYF